MGIAVAFTGPSNSGKTTLIEKIATILIPDYQVAIIKHDPKDKAIFDREGKDSWRFFQTGAEVVVTSPHRTTYFSHRAKELDAIVAMLRPFDILLVEGLKTWPLPRIALFRGKVDPSYFAYSEAVAIDESIDSSLIPSSLEILNLNDPHQIIEWIFQKGKKVEV